MPKKKIDQTETKKPTTWKLDTTLLDDLAKVAKLENRSVTNCAETILKNYCKNKLITVKHHS